MPVAGNAAFRENDDLDLLRGSSRNEPLDCRQVRRLVASGMLKLNGSDANVAHVEHPKPRPLVAVYHGSDVKNLSRTTSYSGGSGSLWPPPSIAKNRLLSLLAAANSLWPSS